MHNLTASENRLVLCLMLVICWSHKRVIEHYRTHNADFTIESA